MLTSEAYFASRLFSNGEIGEKSTKRASEHARDWRSVYAHATFELAPNDHHSGNIRCHFWETLALINV